MALQPSQVDHKLVENTVALSTQHMVYIFKIYMCMCVYNIKYTYTFNIYTLNIHKYT